MSIMDVVLAFLIWLLWMIISKGLSKTAKLKTRHMPPYKAYYSQVAKIDKPGVDGQPSKGSIGGNIILHAGDKNINNNKQGNL
jgi:hypothetical protein